MAAATVMTAYDVAVAWQQRSMELAAARGAVATLEAENVNGMDVYSVPSSTHSGEVHMVRFHQHAGQLECDCTAAHYGRACSHSGAVLALMAEQEETARIWREAAGKAA